MIKTPQNPNRITILKDCVILTLFSPDSELITAVLKDFYKKTYIKILCMDFQIYRQLSSIPYLDRLYYLKVLTPKF